MDGRGDDCSEGGQQRGGGRYAAWGKGGAAPGRFGAKCRKLMLWAFPHWEFHDDFRGGLDWAWCYRRLGRVTEEGRGPWLSVVTMGGAARIE